MARFGEYLDLSRTLPYLIFIGCNLILHILIYLFASEPMMVAHAAYVRLQAMLWLIAFEAVLFFWADSLIAAILSATRICFGETPANIIAVTLQTAFTSFILIDCAVYALLGIHLYDDEIIQQLTIKGLLVSVGSRLALLVFGFIFAIVVGESALLYYIQRTVKARSIAYRKFICREVYLKLGLLLAISVAFSRVVLDLFAIDRVAFETMPLHRSHPIETMPLYRSRSIVTKNAAVRLSAGYRRLLRRESAAAMKKKPDILYFLVESLRSDMITPETTPNIWKYMAQGQCIRSHNHFSGGNVSQLGAFSSLYGLNAYRYTLFSQYATNASKGIDSLPLALLRHNGYRLIGLDASGLKTFAIAPIKFSQFDTYVDFNNEDDRLIAWLEDFSKHRASDKPLFAFLFFFTTHYPYDSRPGYRKFQPEAAFTMEDIMPLLMQKRTKFKREHLMNRYKNSVYYFDHLFGKVMDTFAADIRAGNLVIALAGDHGEEFFEYGGFDHVAPRFENVRVQTAFMLCLPGITPRVVPLSSHADIWPTILEWAGTKPRLRMGYDFDGASLLNAAPEKFVIVAGLPGSSSNVVRHVCVVTGKRKYMLLPRGSGDFRVEHVTDIDDKAIEMNSKELADSDRALFTFEKGIDKYFQ